MAPQSREPGSVCIETVRLILDSPVYAPNKAFASTGTEFALTAVRIHIEPGRPKKMDEENSTGNNLIWAVTIIIIVAIIAGALFYSTRMRNDKKTDIDVEIKVPAR